MDKATGRSKGYGFVRVHIGPAILGAIVYLLVTRSFMLSTEASAALSFNSSDEFFNFFHTWLTPTNRR